MDENTKEYADRIDAVIRDLVANRDERFKNFSLWFVAIHEGWEIRISSGDFGDLFVGAYGHGRHIAYDWTRYPDEGPAPVMRDMHPEDLKLLCDLVEEAEFRDKYAD